MGSRNKIKTIDIAAHLDLMGCNSGKLCSPEQNFDDKIKEMADKNIRDPTQRESNTSDHFNPKRTSRVSVSLASNETKEFTIDDVVTQDWRHNPNARPKTKSVLKKIQTEESSEEDSD